MNSTLAVTFAFADSTTRTFSIGNYNPNDTSLETFKNRVKNFDKTDTTSGKKFTNLAQYLKSDSGAAFTAVKSATITTSQTRRIFDSSTYNP